MSKLRFKWHLKEIKQIEKKRKNLTAHCLILQLPIPNVQPNS